jgi:hypothetical protein
MRHQEGSGKQIGVGTEWDIPAYAGDICLLHENINVTKKNAEAL